MPHAPSAPEPSGSLTLPRRIGRGVPSEERGRVNMDWLIHLQWWAILGQILLIVGSELFAGIDLPLGPLAVIVAGEALGNLGLTEVVKRVRVTDVMVVLVMLADAVVLTVLLDFTGGAINPFATLYLVNVGLAAVLLPQRWAWTLMVASLACYASLFAHDAVQLGHAIRLHGTAMEQMAAHLRGGWVAFSLAAFFTVYFVQRVASALDERERELREARAQVERKEKLASLATLAAGAAHELSTPLSTIAVVAKELQRALADGGTPEVRTDLQLVRDQVARCREILDRMSANAGEAAGRAHDELHHRRLGRGGAGALRPQGPGARRAAGRGAVDPRAAPGPRRHPPRPPQERRPGHRAGSAGHPALRDAARAGGRHRGRLRPRHARRRAGPGRRALLHHQGARARGWGWASS